MSHVRTLARRAPAVALATLLVLARAALAQGAPVPQTLEEADAQRARAEQMRRDADARYAEEQQACYAKFLVNDCLDAAKKKRTATMIEARELDLPAREFQRDAKRADVDARDRKRADEAPQRAAEQQQQAEAFRAEEARRAAEREQKIADKARQAEEGRKKTAEEDARRAQKLAAGICPQTRAIIPSHDTSLFLPLRT